VHTLTSRPLGVRAPRMSKLHLRPSRVSKIYKFSPLPWSLYTFVRHYKFDAWSDRATNIIRNVTAELPDTNVNFSISHAFSEIQVKSLVIGIIQSTITNEVEFDQTLGDQGVDSLAIAHIFQRISETFDLPITVDYVHMNSTVRDLCASVTHSLSTSGDVNGGYLGSTDITGDNHKRVFKTLHWVIKLVSIIFSLMILCCTFICIWSQYDTVMTH